jgi:hypothetical protein
LEGRLIEMNGTSWRHTHQRLNPMSQEYSLWEKKTLALDIIAQSTSVSLISDSMPLHSPHCTAPGCYPRSMSALASRSVPNASRASSSFQSTTKEPLNVAVLPWCTRLNAWSIRMPPFFPLVFSTPRFSLQKQPFKESRSTRQSLRKCH